MFRWILKFWCGLWISWLCLIATCCNDKLRIMAMAIAQHEVALHKDIVVMRRATTSDPHLQPPPLSGVLQYERCLGLVDSILHCDDLAAEKFRALQTVMDVWEWEDMLAIEHPSSMSVALRIWCRDNSERLLDRPDLIIDSYE